MPKVSQTDILTLILRDLDQIIETQKKAGIGSVPEATTKEAQAEATALGGTLSNLAVSLKMLSKISVKDVSNIVSTISSLSIAIKNTKLSNEDVEGFSNMMSVLGTLNSTFGTMSIGLGELIKNFNPARGWIIGKSLAKFYKNIIKQFEKENLSDYIKTLSKANSNGTSENMVGFSSVLTSLFSIDTKNLVKVSKALKKLSPKAGQNLADFISPIIDVIKKMPPVLQNKQGNLKDGGTSTWVANPNIAGFVSVFNAITSITTGQVMRIWFMSKMLGEKQGAQIANFFESLLKPFLGKKMIDASKNFQRVVNTFNLVIISLVACLSIITLLVVTKPKDFTIALSVMTLLVISMIGIIKLLSNTSIEEGSKKSMFTVASIMIIIGGLTLVLAITTHIAKKYSLLDIGLGILLMVTIVGISLLTMKALSNKSIQESSVKSLITVAAILLLIGGIALISKQLIKVGKNWKEVGIGAVTSLVIAGLGSLLLWGFSKINEETIVKGIIGAAGVLLVLYSVVKVTGMYMNLMKKIGNLTAKEIAVGSALVIGIVTGTAGIIFAASSLVAGPQGIVFALGAAAMLTISGVLEITSMAIDSFLEMIKHINTVSKEDIQNACGLMTAKDGIVDAIKKIVEGLSDIGFWASIKIKHIARNLNPVFKGISKFVDVIQKMTTMKIIDHFDEKGNPVYRKMEFSEFSEAAENLSTGFSSFLTAMTDSMDVGKSRVLRRTLRALRKGGLAEVMIGVSGFVDAIQKMGLMQMPQTDENGNILKDSQGNILMKKMPDNVFITAAQSLATGFTTFLTTLVNSFDSRSARKTIKRMMRALNAGKGGIGSVMTGVSTFIDGLLKIASGTIEVERDGKKVSIPIGKQQLLSAVDVLTSAFSTFLTQISNNGDTLDSIDFDDLDNATKASNSIIKTLTSIIKADFVRNDILGHVTAFNTASKEMFTLLDKSTFKNYDADGFAELVNDSKEGIDNLLKSFNSIIELTKKSSLTDITTAFHENVAKILSISNIKYSKRAIISMSILSKMLDQHIVSSFGNTFEQILSYNFADRNLEGNVTSFGNSLITLLGFISEASKKVTRKEVKDFGSIMKKLTKSMNSSLVPLVATLDKAASAISKFLPGMKVIQKNILTKIPKEVDKVTKSIRRLDATLIGNQKKRIEAIQTMSDKFAEVSKSIEDLNKSMAQSNKIIREFEGEKESRSFSIFGHLADRFNVVDKIKSNVEDTAIAAKAQADELSKRNQKTPEIDTAAIVAAITAGLNEWVESQKIVNITFGEDDAKRIVGIMGES